MSKGEVTDARISTIGRMCRRVTRGAREDVALSADASSPFGEGDIGAADALAERGTTTAVKEIFLWLDAFNRVE